MLIIRIWTITIHWSILMRNNDGSLTDLEEYKGRYQINSEGNIWSILKNKWLKGCTVKVGNNQYQVVNLYHADGVATRYYIHGLVAITFIPNPDNLPYVTHKDGDTLNNSSSNLKWSSHFEVHNPKYQKKSLM